MRALILFQMLNLCLAQANHTARSLQNRVGCLETKLDQFFAGLNATMQRNNKQEIAKDMQWKQSFAHNMYWFRMQLNRLEEKFEKAMNFKNIQFHIFKSHLLKDLTTKVKQFNAHTNAD